MAWGDVETEFAPLTKIASRAQPIANSAPLPRVNLGLYVVRSAVVLRGSCPEARLRWDAPPMAATGVLATNYAGGAIPYLCGAV